MKNIILFLIVIFSLNSCKKGENLSVPVSVKLSLAHVSGSEPLQFDNIIYTNQAANNYSVSRLQYFISDFTFLGETPFYSDEVFYVDAANGTMDINFLDFTPGEYTGISFTIGLPPEKNISNILPATVETTSMAWPDQMGGGYHFLKMEGQFKDTSDHAKGYALHLGMTGNQVNVTINQPMVIKYNGHAFELKMDVNKWFGEPNVYDLNANPAYTMTNHEAMMKISANGKHVFSLAQVR